MTEQHAAGAADAASFASTELTPHQQDLVSAVKRLEQHFITQLRFIGGISNGDRFPSRELSIAHTKIQEASMWAQRHISN